MENGHDNFQVSNDGLFVEKRLVQDYMEKFGAMLSENVAKPLRKNAEDSTNLRVQGNSAYTNKSHNSSKHQKMWDLFTRSVATAPNDSSELSLAYEARSIFTQHMAEYEECIKDCERGFKVSRTTDLAKANFLIRKVECLTALQKQSLKNVCEDALETFERYNIGEEARQRFVDKLMDTLDKVASGALKKKKKKPKTKQKFEKKDEPALISNRSTEAPCASSALAIAYSKRWGRHVVATRRIEPGEVVVIEKSYFTAIGTEGTYMLCSHCVQPTWASIACKGCVFNVYCSERCKTVAWKRYHQFECLVLPYVYNNLDLRSYPHLNKLASENCNAFVRAVGSALKLMISSVHEVGGLEQIKKELIDIESNKGDFFFFF